MRYCFSLHSECIHTSTYMNVCTYTHTYIYLYVHMHMCTHRRIYLVLSHGCMCACTGVCMCIYSYFQIYLSAIVIELIVLIDKPEFSPRSFLSFSIATNKKKNVPTPRNKSGPAKLLLTENSPHLLPPARASETQKLMQCP